MKAVVLQTRRCEMFSSERLTRSSKRTRRAKARIVEQDDEHVRRSTRWTSLADGRELGLGILRVVGHQAAVRLIRNGKDTSFFFVVVFIGIVHRRTPAYSMAVHHSASHSRL